MVEPSSTASAGGTVVQAGKVSGKGQNWTVRGRDWCLINIKWRKRDGRGSHSNRGEEATNSQRHSSQRHAAHVIGAVGGESINSPSTPPFSCSCLPFCPSNMSVDLCLNSIIEGVGSNHFMVSKTHMALL